MLIGFGLLALKWAVTLPINYYFLLVITVVSSCLFIAQCLINAMTSTHVVKEPHDEH